MYDIIIGGAGPAGMTAAVYARRAGKSVLVLEAMGYGGQIVAYGDAEEVRRQVEILKSEAVAVACGGGTCCVPFEQAECFRISFVKDGQILGSMISSSGLRGTKEKIALLKNCTVNRVICRGIGAGALSQLEAAGIPCDVVREEGCDAAGRHTGIREIMYGNRLTEEAAPCLKALE